MADELEGLEWAVRSVEHALALQGYSMPGQHDQALRVVAALAEPLRQSRGAGTESSLTDEALRREHQAIVELARAKEHIKELEAALRDVRYCSGICRTCLENIDALIDAEVNS